MTDANPYLVVCLDREVPAAAAAYVAELVDGNVPVCLVLVDDAAVARFRSAATPDPLLQICALLPAEPLRGSGRRLNRLYTALVRPWLLGRNWRALRAEAATAERVVAADMSATTLVWHLCRADPHIVATTALDPPVAALRRES